MKITKMNNHNLVHNYFFNNKEKNNFSKNIKNHENLKKEKPGKCFKCEKTSNFKFRIKDKNYFLCYFHYRQ